MNLPYDYHRCVGKTDWATKEPGKPERQWYMAPALEDSGECINRIGPA